MAPCPSEETLTRLLADELTRTERDSVALHVEACGPCQESLARLTESSGTEKSQPATPFAVPDEAEEEIVSRLKLARRTLAVDSAKPKSGAFGQRGLLDSAPSSAAWPIVPGYEIIGVLGSGGMAVVFKARQLALQRTVALKMLRNWSRVGEKAQARFHAEAGVIARLQHPNILQIYDIGDLDGRP
jgi:eukaryotic-like serine/threonine-protein kinase